MKTQFKLSLLALMFCFRSYGSDVSYTHSQSDTSSGNSISISGKISDQLKIGLSAASTLDTSGATDNKTSYIKLNSRFKIDSDSSFQLELKKSDESYNYEGQSLAAKYSFRFFDLNPSGSESAKNKLNFKIELGKKNYSLDSSESISSRKLSASYDRDFPFNIAAGFEISASNYLASGTESKNTLNSITSSNSDISSYSAALVKSATGLYLEKVFNETLTLGISLSRDLPLLSSGSQSDGAELYTDYQVNEDLSISLSFGKTSINTSSPTTSSSFGLLFSF